MRTNNRINFVLAMLLVAVFALACSFGDETKQANELIAKANKSVTEANEASQKGGKRIVEMEAMVDKIAGEKDLEEARGVARECKDLFTKAHDGYKEASTGFTDAGKLKVNEKFKEYVDTKAAEFVKRGEIMTAATEEAQALLDSENRDAYHTKVKTIVERFNKAKDDADALGKKAEKIQTDNKDVFVELK